MKTKFHFRSEIMTSLDEKIKILTNRFPSVTKYKLIEASALVRPFVIDDDLYLSIQAVMMNITNESPISVMNFIYNVINKIDISDGFEIAMYRIYHQYKSFKNEDDGILYLVKTFGVYDFSKGLILIENINLIEEYRYKIK